MVLNMVYYRIMIKLNISQAKTHLSAYLARLRRGETIVLRKRNTPIAEIRPLPHPRMRKRPIGLAAGEFTVPASFFDPQAPDRYLPQLRERHGIESLALDEDAVMQIGKLPSHHRDPFDRMLVCQALAHGLTLLTPDPLISRYPVRTAW